MQSHLGFVSEIAAMLITIFLGYIMEVAGRKIPCVIGLTISSLALIATPLSKSLGGLYIFRVLTGIGVLPLI